MDKAILYCVAIPCTQHVQDILNILSITHIRQPEYTEFTKGYGLFIYESALELENIDYDSEWVINDEDALIVLTLFANKDFKGICAYLNNIPERPFNVFIDSTYLT